MINVLMVDDDPKVLEGLRRSLHSMRHEWKMQFADSGAAALQLLEREPVDVVVSDMRMRGLDGAQLLAEVKRRHPETVRLVLSGQAEPDLILRATGVAHQYLAKPCDLAVLKTAIARSQRLKRLLSDDRLAELVGPIDALPSVPKAYQQLVACLNDPDSSLENVTRIIRHDAPLTANILKLSNSAFFGVRNAVTNVERAIEFIGTDTIVALVLGYGVFTTDTPIRVPGFSLEHLGKHSFETAACARAIARYEKLPTALTEAAFLAGVLHDIGQLVLALREPPTSTLTLTLAQMQAHHAEVGAYLLGLWGFSDVLIEAIAFHHTPSRASEREFGLCGLLHVADCLAHRREGDPDDPAQGTEPGYLENLGLQERLCEWRESVPQPAGEEAATC